MRSSIRVVVVCLVVVTMFLVTTPVMAYQPLVWANVEWASQLATDSGDEIIVTKSDQGYAIIDYSGLSTESEEQFVSPFGPPVEPDETLAVAWTDDYLLACIIGCAGILDPELRDACEAECHRQFGGNGGNGGSSGIK